MLRLHDTATGSVRPLALRDPGEVSIYVCGLTVYDRAHVGHGRMAIVFDVLRRYLLFNGLRVHYVSNVTDVDDKIIERAAREGRTESEVAQEFEDLWWQDVDSLGVLRPGEIPHATDYVSDMVNMIEGLVRNESAYETSAGVYLDVSKIDGYGLLARQSLESLRAGARIEVDDAKRSPLDFALWKKAKPDEPTWDSPWGPGRPGWHTECVVMSLDLLGDGFDLHGGGIDLKFPHHENERAQAVAQGREFARHWMHNGFVEVSGEKMSKSLGNFETVADLLTKEDPRAFRLLVLFSHYRSPIEVTPQSLGDASRALDRLDRCAERFGLTSPLDEGDAFVTIGMGSAASIDPEELAHFQERMDDDLDTPAAMARVFDLIGHANTLGDTGDTEAGCAVAETAVVLCAALGLGVPGGPLAEVDAESAQLVAERDAAREARDWKLADQIRDALVARGWVVEDGPNGTRLRR